MSPDKHLLLKQLRIVMAVEAACWLAVAGLWIVSRDARPVASLSLVGTALAFVPLVRLYRSIKAKPTHGLAS